MILLQVRFISGFITMFRGLISVKIFKFLDYLHSFSCLPGDLSQLSDAKRRRDVLGYEISKRDVGAFFAFKHCGV